jgi:hypothetical protein
LTNYFVRIAILFLLFAIHGVPNKPCMFNFLSTQAQKGSLLPRQQF